MIIFLSCVKSVPDLASQPGFFATGTDERLLLRGRRMTSDHLSLRCGELGDGDGVGGDKGFSQSSISGVMNHEWLTDDDNDLQIFN